MRGEIESGVVRQRLFGRRVSGRVESFCIYALAKIGDPNSLRPVMQPLVVRGHDRLARRATALALGEFAGAAQPAAQAEALAHLERLRDPSTRHFACITRGRMATKKSLSRLLELAEGGRHSERAFAALGLAVPELTNRQYPPGLKEAAIAKLRELAAASRAYDIKAAYLIALGAMKDKKAWPLMKRFGGGGKAARSDLLAHTCLAMGLLGEPKDEVRAFLRKTMGDGSLYVRGCAATGLAYIGDPRDEALLLDEFESAKNFGYQGRLAGLMRAVGGAKTRDRCLAILKNRKLPTRTRALAAAILGEIADPRAVSPLARIAQGYNYRASIADLDELLFVL
ncbi:MAG: hypothetical protein O7E54_12755 [Planctomycetota bacterium]|nr:hypothetical protein [Planctomycetota bacterium]